MLSVTFITFIVSEKFATLEFCHTAQTPRRPNTYHYTDSHFPCESKTKQPTVTSTPKLATISKSNAAKAPNPTSHQPWAASCWCTRRCWLWRCRGRSPQCPRTWDIPLRDHMICITSRQHRIEFWADSHRWSASATQKVTINNSPEKPEVWPPWLFVCLFVFH